MRQKHGFFSLFLLSPSSRRAWIEMCICFKDVLQGDVALLAEGVDRNWISYGIKSENQVALLAEGVDRNVDGRQELVTSVSRPPRGGRG